MIGFSRADITFIDIFLIFDSISEIFIMIQHHSVMIIYIKFQSIRLSSLGTVICKATNKGADYFADYRSNICIQIRTHLKGEK